ncbi:MAG TPA: pyridoxamine 5'-phosphate oxidase family protein [Gemmatimonadaceae bacterium]|nr:pyridoxamine 5'-phosphate oxidase family protein [Gemmatimonadaceae bacterium]
MSSISARGPRIRELSARQIEIVLRRNNVGRIGFRRDERLELCPVHYVYADGCIYGRTSLGAKYDTWLSRPPVVFEVDEITGIFDWRSVVVHGTISILRARGAKAEPFAYWNAVAAIRSFMPDAFTERDALPRRLAVFRIQPDELSGREATRVKGWDSPMLSVTEESL